MRPGPLCLEFEVVVQDNYFSLIFSLSLAHLAER